MNLRKLLYALLVLCTLFFSITMSNCGGYDNGTSSSNVNGNDNMNDNNGPYE